MKSLAAIELQHSNIVDTGFALDRQWLITDSNRQFLTQRQIPEMACVKVAINNTHIILEHHSQQPLYLPIDQPGKSVTTQVWNDTCTSIDQGKDASLWLTQALGRWRGQELLLFKYDASHARTTKESGLYTSFSDGYPLLICNQQSLAQLNQHLKQNQHQPIPMTRFRPSIVIDGLPAFAENTVNAINNKDGNYLFNMHQPCERCIVTSIDQRTGKKADPQQPLKALIELRTQMSLPANVTKKGAFFGRNASLLGNNPNVAVGDILQL